MRRRLCFTDIQHAPKMPTSPNPYSVEHPPTRKLHCNVSACSVQASILSVQNMFSEMYGISPHCFLYLFCFVWVMRPVPRLLICIPAVLSVCVLSCANTFSAVTILMVDHLFCFFLFKFVSTSVTPPIALDEHTPKFGPHAVLTPWGNPTLQ